VLLDVRLTRKNHAREARKIALEENEWERKVVNTLFLK
jgi:hypothetical protein